MALTNVSDSMSKIYLSIREGKVARKQGEEWTQYNSVSGMIHDGIIENQGVEFELGGEIIQKRDIGLSATLFFSANENKVVDIGTVELLIGLELP